MIKVPDLAYISWLLTAAINRPPFKCCLKCRIRVKCHFNFQYYTGFSCEVVRLICDSESKWISSHWGSWPFTFKWNINCFPKSFSFGLNRIIMADVRLNHPGSNPGASCFPAMDLNYFSIKYANELRFIQMFQFRSYNVTASLLRLRGPLPLPQ